MNEAIACAKIADQNRIVDSIWVPESWGRESFATLGALSQVTKRVRLGTSIVSIYARTPATVAMACSTLDILSNNRAIIGLGASTPNIVENWHGVIYDNPVGRMREYVDCLKMTYSGDMVKYDGRYFRLKNFKLLHQAPRKKIPIFMAAINKKMLSLASEISDGVLLYLRPLDELKRTAAELRLASKGKPFDIASSFICAVSNGEPDRAHARAARTLAFYVAVGKYYSRFLANNGFEREVGQILQGYSEGGTETAVKFVSNRMLDSLAIYGTSEECRHSLSRFISAGITLPILQINPVLDSETSIKEILSTF
ncbi:MAG TPA: LLM class flavin-dependent oxidoreductase [Nitrososphaera sp.]